MRLGRRDGDEQKRLTSLQPVELRPAGFEPATCGLGNRRSIHLSYERGASRRFRFLSTHRYHVNRNGVKILKRGRKPDTTHFEVAGPRSEFRKFALTGKSA